MIKVSVVVPTYNSNEENLNRILDSFNKQSLNQEEFEVIFVDDGSNDFQSYKRLKERIEEKPNYFAYRVSPSGGRVVRVTKERNKHVVNMYFLVMMMIPFSLKR
ncbi:glycosyltransferase [Bacillus sp. JCM 19046]|nr:glycosyltransferase [Bacillus sp. JCM 19045]GAF18285.1 glycosyltransferase [Bacillus sp. JCM 19046]